MKYKLVLFDVDSTLINQEVIDLLAIRTPFGNQVSEITERAMAGELNFDEALRERVKLLQGLPESIFTEVLADISFSQGAKELIFALKKASILVGVVSGGFVNVLNYLFSDMDLDFMRANTLEVSNGKLTGRTIGKIINRQGKAEALRDFANISKISLDECVAVGDGSNDLDMVKIAGLGVSYRGKPILNEAADLIINEPGLDKLLNYL